MTAVGEGGQARAEWRAWIGRRVSDPAIRQALVIFLAFRLLTGVVGIVAVAPARPVGTPFFMLTGDAGADRAHDTYQGAFPTDGLLRQVMWPWFVWDTQWYVGIAQGGYGCDPGARAFPPLYPALIRAVAGITGDCVLGAFLIDDLACLAALILFFKLVLLDFGDLALARWSALWLLGWPTGFFLLAGYTEGLFLAFVLGAWLAARKRHVALSGVLAMCATLTRAQGLILIAPLWYVVWRDWLREEPSRRFGRLLLRSGMVAVGPLVGWWGYTAGLAGLGYGDATAVFADQWQIATVLPWEGLAGNLRMLFTASEFKDWLNLGTLIGGMGLGLWGLRVLPFEYSLFTWGSLAVLLTRLPPQPFTSMSRYVLTVFPLFFLVAHVFQRLAARYRWGKLARLLVLEGSILLQLDLLRLFVHWTFVA